MGTLKPAALALLLLVVACARAEPATVQEIKSDMAGNVGRTVRLEGQVVRDESDVVYVSIGDNYFTLRDRTGAINVWYGPTLHCAPMRGSRVSVVGKVMKPEQTAFHIFGATRLKVESSPPLGENQVRLCSLSIEDQQTYQLYGIEALHEEWRRRGRPVRDVVEY